MANPFPLEFEEILNHFFVVQAQCTLFEGPAPAPFPDNTPDPLSNIRLDQAWGVTFEWRTLGALNFLMAGDWELTVYLERMGGGEFTLPNNSQSVAFVSAPNTYAEVIDFPAGAVVDEGAYRVVTTVNLRGPTGFQGPIAAVGEGPIANFYAVGP